MDSLWDMLSSSNVLLFGRESATSSAVIFVVLLLRAAYTAAATNFTKLIVPFLPVALQPSTISDEGEGDAAVTYLGVFTFLAVFLLQGRLVKSLQFGVGLLPMRLTHCILGRFSYKRFFGIVIPAHFLGAIIGVAAASTVGMLPLNPPHPAVEPLSATWMGILAHEAGVNFTAALILHTLPGTIAVNKRTPLWALLPLLLLAHKTVDPGGVGGGSAFHPTLIYGLQFANSGEHAWLHVSAHIVGPLVGGLFAGFAMSRVFPD
uniref:Uncharacterized protein n=1 Tax=Phaeomonas parva TaxID=124430 RepID=A0A7S1XRB6_9STRA|mmetsp:Transcript_26551/g.83022  ORF Transcript_26551/g.83022 Transcript_26551/m.83022 type:complete len:262 (+) Transcript_26551:135-920(+)